MAPKLPDDIRTPAYVLDVAALKRNLETAARIKREAGIKILLATKAWAMPAAFPLIRDMLDGTTASGEYEARMGREDFGKEVHVYAPAYGPGEVERLTRIADHIYFNSPEQISGGLKLAKDAGREVGIRINPGYSNATLGGALYDPCAPNSRFGTTVAEIDQLPGARSTSSTRMRCARSLADGSVGLIEHVGTQLRALPAPREGGELRRAGISSTSRATTSTSSSRPSRPSRRSSASKSISSPARGSSCDTGYLVSTVIGMHRNEKEIAILDASASTHMPDVLEVPYTPPVLGAEAAGVLPHSYILGGKTCMTGDIIGEYSFAEPLVPGSRVVFGDMMQYSFVKNTTFNGTPLPDLAMLHEDGRYEVVRSFGYEEFRRRLG